MKYALFILLVFPTTPWTEQIEPFTSDGCSAFPDGNFDRQQLWLSCCTAHDYAYWKGGTYAARVKADEALRQCVERLGEPAIGLVMQMGVRIGGSPFWPTTFRWGYGWPFPRGYQPLTNEEQLEIDGAGN